MLRYALLFYIFCTCKLDGQIHQQVATVEKDLKNIETFLQQPLTNDTINIIEGNLAQATKKIITLEHELPTSNEKGNPFSPRFIQEIKQKIDKLKAEFAGKKRSLEKLYVNNDTRASQLLDQWYTYQLQTIDNLSAPTIEISNSIKPAIKTDLFTAASAKKMNNQKAALSHFYTKAIQAVAGDFKNMQNTFFDLSFNYQQTCDQTFSNIVHIINHTPPPVPTRSSSLYTKIVTAGQLKTAEPSILQPHTEKSLLEKIQEQASTVKKSLEQNISQAKEFAAKHMSSIDKSIRALQKPASNLEEKYVQQNPTNLFIKNKTTLSIDIKSLIDAIYNSSDTYKKLSLYGLHFDMLHRLMNFIKFPEISLFADEKPGTTQMADNSALTVQKLIHSLLNKKNEFYLKNLFHGELYYAIFVLPTLFYGMLINNNISWVSDKARLLSNKIGLYLENNAHAPYTFDFLSPDQVEECASYVKAILKTQTSLTAEDLLKQYFFLDAITVIIGQNYHGITQLDTIVSNNIIEHIKNVKNNTLSFIQNFLFKTIQSPFEPASELYKNTFLIFSGFKEIELFSLLYKTKKNPILTKQVGQELVVAKKAIYNAFKVCAKKTKAKIRENDSLRTPWTILYEQLERIVALLKPTVQKDK
ncbi:hypothetical protein EKK58_01465 [Candidatus Dependentiae bacterium]|nr:MAG: hypothetical protein EKK58_01465 [Candidatus Dependentiae bacterium]